jgi:hypothetical protein
MPRMERFELLLLVASVGLVVVTFGIERLRRGDLGFAGRVGLGLAAGTAAALVVLALQIDLVPDEVEAIALPVVVIVLTIGAAWGTWLRLARG